MAQVRANWLKLVVGTAKRQSEPVSSLILGALGPDFRAEIRTASSLTWLPATQFARVHEALHGALGAGRAELFWRQMMLDALERPMLAPLRSGALGMFGNTPASLLKFTPHAWSLVTRGCARVRFDGAHAPDSPAWTGACSLSFAEFAPELPPSLIEPLLVGGAGASLDLLGFDGEAVRGEGSTPRRVEVQVRWRPRSAATDADHRHASETRASELAR